MTCLPDSTNTIARVPFDARVLTVLIASPGDTANARDTVERTITSWNRDRAARERTVLVPLRWETDAVPELGNDAQSVINRQLVDECDIVIALFHSRLGAPTERSASGTVEEIERARARSVPVHVYFSEMAVPRTVDPDELKRLNGFRTDLQAKGLLGSYVSLDDLSAKVRTALERDIQQLVSAVPTDDNSEPVPHAILRARYEFDREPHTDSRGQVQMRTRRERLVIENLGTVPAENVEIVIDAVGQGEAPVAHIEGPIERILPRAAVSVTVLVHMGVASQWRLTLRWTEGDQHFEESQTITPF
jgi:hypothetical protein